MMDHESQLKLQAYADGELSAAEAREVEELLGADTEAQQLVDSIAHIRTILKDSEIERPLPESREFYWSKIERQIAQKQPGRTREQASFFAAIRRFLNPAGAVAAVVLIALITLLNFRPGNWNGPGAEAVLSDPGALTYVDYRNGTTLVWLTYPADSDYE